MFNKEFPDVLYHYCSVGSFYNIIKSKSIWLCNGLNMNDKYDSMYLERIAEEWLNDKKATTDDELIQELCDTFKLVLTEYKIERPLPFISSFCSEADLLSQWIAYADKGKGVAIGFSSEKLFEYSVNDPMSFLYPFREIDESQVLLYKLEYEDENARRLINNLFSFFLNIFLESKNKEKARYELAVLFCGAVFRNSPIYKNSVFQHEYEWRLIRHCQSRFSNSEIIGNTGANVDFELINGKIKSHITLDFDNNIHNGLIKEIILGPTFAGNEYDFRFFISQNIKSDVCIKRSVIPYVL